MEPSSEQWPPEAENGDISFFYQLEPEINSLDQYFTAAQIMEEHQSPLPSLNLPHASSFPLHPQAASSEFSGAIAGFPFGRPVPTVTSGLLSADQEPSGFLPVGNSLFVPQNDMNNLFVPHDRSTWSSDKYTSTTLDFQRQETRNNMGVSRPAAAAASSSSTPEHVMAERKRRERLNQQFVALSSIIPGLKKTDKATLLGDAIGYIRQLEQKVKTLEEKASERTVESTILVKKSNPSATDIDSVSNSGEAAFPKITASMKGSCILVRIQCENRKGLFVKVLSVMEKHHLSVINTNVMPFASSCVNITVTAQIEEGFATAMKDLVKDIDSALSLPMQEEIRV